MFLGFGAANNLQTGNMLWTAYMQKEESSSARLFFPCRNNFSCGIQDGAQAFRTDDFPFLPPTKVDS